MISQIKNPIYKKICMEITDNFYMGLFLDIANLYNLGTIEPVLCHYLVSVTVFSFRTSCVTVYNGLNGYFRWNTKTEWKQLLRNTEWYQKLGLILLNGIIGASTSQVVRLILVFNIKNDRDSSRI